ncbi:unnamed protein product, partial [Symbiodinium necroappetens]
PHPQMPEPQVSQGTQPPHVAGQLGVLCLNVNSLVRHRDALLDLAVEQHADILMVQETGCTSTQWPAMCKYFHHRRWQLVGVPAATVPGGGRGGVAIIVRDPLSVTTLDSFAGKHGQCISVAVHGQALPLMVSCCYRRPGPDLELLEPLARHVQAFGQRPWLVGGDFNLSPSLGPLPDLLKSFGGRVPDLTATWCDTAVSAQEWDAEATLAAPGSSDDRGVQSPEAPTSQESCTLAGATEFVRFGMLGFLSLWGLLTTVLTLSSTLSTLVNGTLSVLSSLLRLFVRSLSMSSWLLKARAVGPKVRFSDVASRLDPQCLGQLQYGGLKGHDCEWVTFGGLVDPRPIDNAPALLQGDVWAFYALALCKRFTLTIALLCIGLPAAAEGEVLGTTQGAGHRTRSRTQKLLGKWSWSALPHGATNGTEAQNWLRSVRIDADLARNQQLVITPRLVQALHVGVQRHDGFAVGVAIGGFQTPAVDFDSENIRADCPFCHQSTVPSLQHVCWACPCFADLRKCSAPRSLLVARLGWDQQGIDHAVLSQLGSIRKRVLNLTKAEWKETSLRTGAPAPLDTSEAFRRLVMSKPKLDKVLVEPYPTEAAAMPG